MGVFMDDELCFEELMGGLATDGAFFLLKNVLTGSYDRSSSF